MDLLKFGADFGVEVAEFPAGFDEGAVERLSGFDTEEHEIEGGGEGGVDAIGSFADLEFEDAFGEEESESAGADGGEGGEAEVFPNEEGGPAGDDGDADRGGGFRAVEEADGVGTAIAGGDELFTEGTGAAAGRGGDFADEEDGAEQWAPAGGGGGIADGLGGKAPAEQEQDRAHTSHHEEEEEEGEDEFAHDVALHADAGEALDQEVGGDIGDDGGIDEGPAGGAGSKDHDVFGVDDEHHEEDAEGEESQDHAGHPAVDGDGADFAFKNGGIAHAFADAGEDIVEAAADAILHFDGGGEEADFGDGDAVGHVVEGLVPTGAEFPLIAGAAHFAGEGFGLFHAEEFDGGGERVTGLEGAGEGIEGFGELVGEFAKAFGAAAEDEEVGGGSGAECANGGDPGGHPRGHGEDGAGEGAGEEHAHGDAAGGPVEVGFLDVFAERVDVADAGEQATPDADGAELFLASEDGGECGDFGFLDESGVAAPPGADVRDGDGERDGESGGEEGRGKHQEEDEDGGHGGSVVGGRGGRGGRGGAVLVKRTGGDGNGAVGGGVLGIAEDEADVEGGVGEAEAVGIAGGDHQGDDGAAGAEGVLGAGIEDFDVFEDANEAGAGGGGAEDLDIDAAAGLEHGDDAGGVLGMNSDGAHAGGDDAGGPAGEAVAGDHGGSEDLAGGGAFKERETDGFFDGPDGAFGGFSGGDGREFEVLGGEPDAAIGLLGDDDDAALVNGLAAAAQTRDQQSVEKAGRDQGRDESHTQQGGEIPLHCNSFPDQAGGGERKSLPSSALSAGSGANLRVRGGIGIGKIGSGQERDGGSSATISGGRTTRVRRRG